MLDDRFAYIAGYTYQNGYPHSDIMLLVYDMDEDTLVNTVVFNKPGSNEKPSEFIFTYYSTDRRQKSRCAVASVTDEIVFNNPTTKYLTIYFAPDLQQNIKVKWSKTISNGPLSRTNVATSIAADALGDVYVSGYMFNYDNATQSNGLDFATVKYNRFDGSFGWNPHPINYYNFNEYTPGIDDKASSVKVNSNKDIFVAGMSDGSQNGFSFIKYEQKPNDPGPTKVYDKVFVPNFVQRDYPVTLTNKYAKIELADDGTPLMIVMGWNQSEAYWSAVKYDANGEIEYTINNQSGEAENAIRYNNKNKITKITLDNYPNPFNPTTKINYVLPVERIGNSFYDVKLTVYNILGAEVATLVNERQNAGSYSVTFDARLMSGQAANLSSGIYFYKLLLNGIAVDTKRMLLVK
ncbi:MAG: T9SS type A sorting domain-containing protein [Bacteroidota bacterium]|nr:T9SS type A sorting domain-containing protein [Bacteroidota bacterium]